MVLGAYIYGSSPKMIETAIDFNDIGPGCYGLTNTIMQQMPNKPDFNSTSRLRLLVFAHYDSSFKTYILFSNASFTFCIGKKTNTGSVSWQYIVPTAGQS